MIRYSLCCKNGHDFEAWFRSSDDFDSGGATACPVCGSKKVEKALMAPALSRADKAVGADVEAEKPDKVKLAAAPDPRMKAMRAALRQIRQHVVDNADYVGERFAEEARKMHYEETEPRAIYGEATGEEASALIDEGIEVQPLPELPEDQN